MKRALFRFSQLLVQLYFRLLFRIEVRGLELVPAQGRLLFAANHISGYDPPLLGCLIPRVLYFMAKQELFEHPLLAALLRFYHCVPIDRAEPGRASVRQIERLLQRDEAVLLFPEGTRTKSGRMGAIKAGIGMIAARNHASIQPIFLHGLFRVRGSFLKRPRVQVIFGKVVAIEPFLQNGLTGKELYLAIAAVAQESIQNLATGEDRIRKRPDELETHAEKLPANSV